MQVRPVIRWKVVFNYYNGKLISAIAGRSMRVSYPVGKWVSATIGGLLVFKNRRAAYNYACCHDSVYKCECREPVTLPPWGLDLKHLTKCNAKTLWDPDARRRVFDWDPNKVSCWPGGTQAFKRIKLVKEVLRK